MLLAGVSLLLSALAVGAALLGVLPARGGEAFFTFAGASLLGAVVLARAAAVTSALSWRRPWSSARGVVAILGVVAAAASLLTSGGLVLFWAMLTGSAKLDEAKIAEGKARHERRLSPTDLASGHAMTADALAKDWMLDHDAADRRHKDEILELTWNIGGQDWVDGTTCTYLLGHGDVVCCFATGAPVPSSGVETLIGRYGATDRRYSTEGKLVIDGCQVK